MRLISLLIAGALMTGCAGMNTKPKPEERFLFLDYGNKFWMEMEYASGDACYQTTEEARKRGDSVKSACSTSRRPVGGYAAFSLQSPRGRFVVRTPSPNACVAAQKMMTRFTEVFTNEDSIALSGEKNISDVTPCKYTHLGDADATD